MTSGLCRPGKKKDGSVSLDVKAVWHTWTQPACAGPVVIINRWKAPTCVNNGLGVKCLSDLFVILVKWVITSGLAPMHVVCEQKKGKKKKKKRGKKNFKKGNNFLASLSATVGQHGNQWAGQTFCSSEKVHSGSPISHGVPLSLCVVARTRHLSLSPPCGPPSE